MGSIHPSSLSRHHAIDKALDQIDHLANTQHLHLYKVNREGILVAKTGLDRLMARVFHFFTLRKKDVIERQKGFLKNRIKELRQPNSHQRTTLDQAKAHPFSKVKQAEAALKEPGKGKKEAAKILLGSLQQSISKDHSELTSMCLSKIYWINLKEEVIHEISEGLKNGDLNPKDESFKRLLYQLREKCFAFGYTDSMREKYPKVIHLMDNAHW